MDAYRVQKRIHGVERDAKEEFFVMRRAVGAEREDKNHRGGSPG
jgi:hypothetical protein